MKISICMATYNGEYYIREQIESINNSGNIHEIIIIDDCSSDDTVKIINSLRQENIRLYKNESNIGVVRSFERALKEVRGDIIFLCDQDDIWLSNKVEEYMNIFKNNLSVDLILSDAYISVDENVIIDTLSDYRGKNLDYFSLLFKNPYVGCCMAFRTTMLKFILPFPSYITMHDIWIGLNATLNDNQFYLDKRLMIYRRHSKNVTALKSFKIKSILENRFYLLMSTIEVYRRKYENRHNYSNT